MVRVETLDESGTEKASGLERVMDRYIPVPELDGLAGLASGSLKEK